MTEDKAIRVLIVDDHPVLREGLSAMIEYESDMCLAGEASNGAEAIERYRATQPDVTIMDLRLPDMSGIEAIIRIRQEFRSARILVLTTYLGDVQVARAMKAGAYSFLLKASLRRDLLETIRAVHRGERRLPAEVANEVSEHAADDALTAREVAVLELVASGKSNKIVADDLCVSEDTVKSHMRSILSKLGANDRTHAVTIALRRGFLDV